MADKLDQSPEVWTESQVSTWLKSIGVKEQYIKKLYEEEVNGQILLTLNEEFLKAKICMKSGPAHLIIQKRDELINSKQREVKQERKKPSSGKKTELELKSVQCVPTASGGPPAQTHESVEDVLKERQTSTSKEDCRPRPFDQEGIDFIYVKHRVLQPESGAFNLTSPCHEFKSFAVAAALDRTRLQAKFAKEVLKFATGCMNIRSNGTIHFGVMDSKEDAGYVHGEIIGIPVKERDIFVDALDYIERSVCSDKEHVRQCVRPPRFIEVMDRESTEKKYVVEVDIVPSISIVKSKVYAVRLPNFKETTNKVEFDKEAILRRLGSKTEPVIDKDLSDFYQRVKDRDAQREEAEKMKFLSAPENCQDLGRKLTMLMTSGKKFMEKDKWFILITNKFPPDDLCNIDWLLNMNIFCVFDFDPDSKISGLCSRYLQHHAANMHSLQSYRIPGDMNIKEFTNQLHLFEQTSWIFCNGRTDYKGNETLCDEMTWIKTKMTFLRESVSLICKQLLPKGTFQVIFLVTSPVEKPLLHTFNEFFTDMEGHEDIICICPSQDNFQKWQNFAEGSCGKETVNNSCVVGMKMSHINATLQQVQPFNSCARKHLPVFVKGTCLLETHEEEQMYSLEILTVDHCDETSKDFINEEKANIEHQFYRGGRVNWLNFWLAEHKYVGEVIERDAYQEVSKLLHEALKWNTDETPVKSINIYHHPGSGGSTVARQVLWNNRKDLRCAVVKPSYSASLVAQHAVELREYEEKDPQKCLTVLLLIEDSDKEYLDDLRNELEVAVDTKRIQYGTPCFILLSCRRSYNPERKCKESPLQNVSVTHKLSNQERRKFSGKREALEERYEPEFILTFVLMSEEFNVDYVQHFVEHLLQGIDRKSVVARLIRYVALLNTYVQNSFISQSHCEALLALTIHMERFHQHEFEISLGPQAQLVFLHLRDEKTHIESIRIIHPLVAKEILQQLLGEQTQSSLAMNLVCESVLFEHRFGRDEYLSFLRALFIRRSRISKGDKYDSFFSPLIEHVCDKEKSPAKAIELLTEAFERFHKDPFFAQQLARLHYTYEKFEEAKHWAETAAKQQPNNSYILDTKGQVYRKWFQAKCKVIDNDNVPKTAHNTADAVETALKALECFQECEKAANADMENVNNSGFFAEVEVGCSLLKLISSLDVFAYRTNGHSECMKYLLTDYIPEEVKDAWEPFHGRLKKLQKTMQDALEWISEDLSYFQTDIDGDEEEIPGSPEEKISQPLTWLVKKSFEYGKYFSEAHSYAPQVESIPANLTPFQKRMMIYHLGGGNVTSILSKLTDQRGAVRLLESILSLYPSNPLKANFGQRDIVNYITAHISLNCLSPDAQKVTPLKNLQALCRQFPSDKRKCLPSALFLLTLLFWPEDNDTNHEKEAKYEIVQTAVEHMEKGYSAKKKDIPQRKRRIYTHFFLGNGNGLDKFVHKRKFERVTKGISVSEKRMKWFRGEAWKKPEIGKMLKCVSGWTEDGVVYLEGPQKKKFSVVPLHVRSVPHSNENITFYLGFTFRGPVACNIVVNK
ncbi:sterile alpha motif domain-containing protein 9-like isoform X1 [Labrus mixtus]|uniref:sterile alpha motif domain-containing protein 9-like isoform X1 n=1 Tax=Labrus mixtus TaxID=508554 RepID=UPI0029C05BBA|nr:sterile alpha motif domain-containing protein 9-like isoform X1 [Labrus mixtus]XP_060882399.1 sterile alpha motif domain-containing protein 9-like isoform X1 [Labrus mixtus]XP_060882400.1 sterile alpha motif domain-containing protein 9-like isoform X1 [Labrus mixtus]XP_060882401.1 sterile alpha motif domain-containing protein 9-like isoform X1 [Labrus mixtus]